MPKPSYDDDQHSPRLAAQSTRPRSRRPIIVVAAAVLLFALVIGIAQLGRAGGGQANHEGQEQPQKSGSSADGDTAGGEDRTGRDGPSGEHPNDSQLVQRKQNDSRAMGDVDAPLVMTEFTDLRCPFCASFNRKTLPKIQQKYIDAGKVRLEVRPVAFFGEKSVTAGAAALAAAEQGKFFEFLDAVYRKAPEKGHPNLTKNTLLGFAKEAGVPDMKKFEASMNDAKLQRRIQQETEDAQSLGVNSVPFFVAGDTALAGAQPVKEFDDFLNKQLAAAQQ